MAFTLIGLILLVGAIRLYKTFALYEIKQEFNVLHGRVPEYNKESSGDVKIAAIIDGEKSSKIPKKEEGYKFESVTCDNEAYAIWDNDTWMVSIGNLTTSKTTCTLTFRGTYKESILNGADPVLANNLVPVVIDNTGTVTKANIYEEWYKYEDKKWANAVILANKNITYNDGDVIPESNIESYFVWIPRYKYKIWTNEQYEDLTEITESKVQEIDVIFESKDTPPSTSTSVGSYYTHPAFISMNTNGLWVGKFETGYKGSKSTTAAAVNETDASKVQIKPNVYSWRNVQVANMFYTSYNYQRSMDSHMMKNTEWGAVSYLTNSKYGRCANGVCEEVRINNNSAFITGYASRDVPTTNSNDTYESTSLGVDGTNTYNYKNTLSQVASTTGNYTGIYDMSGGAHEYVMGVMLDSTNMSPLTSQAGFTTYPNEKYYDTYTYSASNTDFSRFKYGDATGELGPFANSTYTTSSQVSSWYDDFARFFDSSKTWFKRGGGYDNGLSAGVFAFLGDTGVEFTNRSFRIVLGV